MGAQGFCLTCTAANARDAFEQLTNEAIERHGHDSYNGTISTCSMGRERMSYPIYSKETVAATNEFIDQHDNGRKWVADYVDMGVRYWIVREVKSVTMQADAKYLQKYVVCNDHGPLRPVSKYAFDKKTDAVKAAIEYAQRGDSGVVVKKMPVKLSGSDTVTEIRVTETRHDKKPKCKKGQIIETMHTYCFYGWAAC